MSDQHPKTSTMDESKPHVTCRCPFCGGTYTAGTTTDGVPVVLHSLPMCDRFEKLDVLDFLKAARLAGAQPLS